MPSVNYEVTHPATGDTVTAGFDDTATPMQMISQLETQGWLKPAEDGAYCIVTAADNRQLVGDQTFASQTVPDGAQLAIRVRANGAGRRRTGPTTKRLEMDFRSLQDIERRGCIGNIKVFADKQCTELISSVDQSHRIRRYIVEYNVRLPVDKLKFHTNWRVLFDLEYGWKTYPSAKHSPYCGFQQRRPWHYRVSKSGHICTLPVGDASYLAGQHVAMVAGLLNADEPYELSHDSGYDRSCYKFYRAKFNGPINADLDIPSLSSSLFNLPTDNPPAINFQPRATTGPAATPTLNLTVKSNQANATLPRLILS